MGRTSSNPWAALATTLAAVVALGARADAQWDRPAAATRLVHEWDFEERAFHLEELPLHWHRVNPDPRDPPRPGYPHYNTAHLSDEQAASGSWSMMLPTRGGSTGVSLSPGVLPAMPGSDYIIKAKLRTVGLAHARACIVARFARATTPDHPGPAGYETIAGAEVVGEPEISEGAWQELVLHMPGHPDAEFLQVELVLLQPRELRGRGPAPYDTEQEDFSGAAYFDDIAVFQAPRLRVTTAQPGNIIISPQRPTLSIDVRDLTGEKLSIEAAVWDMDGALVDRVVFDSGSSGEPIRWSPQITQFGWYRSMVRAFSAKGDVGHAVADLVYAPALPHADDASASRFGIIAEHLHTDEFELLPSIMNCLRLGSVQVAVWGGLQDDDSAPHRASFDRAMELVLEGGHRVSFVLDRVPRTLAQSARVDAERPIDFIARGDVDWISSLESTLTRFGERVQHWQLGPTSGDTVFWEPAALPAAGIVHSALRTLVPSPRVTLPWSAVMAPPSGAVDTTPSAVTLVIPPEAPAASVPEHVRLWRDRKVDVHAVVELLNVDTYGRRALLLELARRASLAWHAGASTVAIAAPWSRFLLDDGTPQIAPKAEGLVIRTLASSLSGLQPAGHLPAPPEVTLLIAEGPTTGGIIAWSDAPSPYTLRAFLGDGPIVVYDIMGESRVVEAESGVHSIPLTDMPLIIRGVDADLARFRAEMRIEPEFIEAQSRRHDLTIHLHNPFDRAITGRVRLAEPEGWSFRPRVLSFAIPPGGETQLTTSIALGVGEEGGERDLLAEIDLTGEKRYPTMALPLSLEIGLRDIELSASYRFLRTPGRASRLVVTATITNLGDKPVSLEAFIQAPGFRGQSAPISALPPGDTTAKVFMFEDADKLVGSSVRIGLRENAGSARLNKTVHIE